MNTPTGASTNPKHFDLNKNFGAIGTLIILYSGRSILKLKFELQY